MQPMLQLLRLLRILELHFILHLHLKLLRLLKPNPKPHAAHTASASRPAADSSSEESTDSSEQERKRRKKKEEEEGKKRKKEKKREEKKKEEAAGGGGVKEEEAAHDIEEVKAEVEDVAVEGRGGRGGGGFGRDPLAAGGGRPCLGPQPSQPAPSADPPLGARGARQRVLPRCPPFFEL